MKDYFIFFPILIIVWLWCGLKYIDEIVTEKWGSVLWSNLFKGEK